MKQIAISLLSLLLVLSLGACGQTDAASFTASAQPALNAASAPVKAESPPDEIEVNNMKVSENFVLIPGGSFTMGTRKAKTGEAKTKPNTPSR